jgi:hypothetical protein
LNFSKADDALRGELSAVAITPDGSLWVGSDEKQTLERLSPAKPCVYGEHRSLPLKEYIDLYNVEGEVDIEGMDYSGQYLWFTGSMSQKREKVKGDKRKKDIQRLGNVTFEQNRYMLGRVPVQGGELFRSVTDPLLPANQLACGGFATIRATATFCSDALQDDEHLGLTFRIPCLAKKMGSTLKAWRCEVTNCCSVCAAPCWLVGPCCWRFEVEETEPGVLGLCEIGDQGRLYKKHFLNLGGRGIRDLVLDGDDLIILAGPTMDVEGTMLFYRLSDAVNLKKDSLFEQIPSICS